MLGVDEDPDFIRAAKHLVAREHLSNVDILQANLFYNDIEEDIFIYPI